MATERVMLKVGYLYRLYGRDGYLLECIRNVPDDGYSPFTAIVRSILTGWTMKVHGVNQYSDGSIDWDFSTDGMFTLPDKKGILHQVDYGSVGYNDIKRWMCIVFGKESITVEFFDQLYEARTFQMDCVCGKGCRCHIYEYINGHYEFRRNDNGYSY